MMTDDDQMRPGYKADYSSDTQRIEIKGFQAYCGDCLGEAVGYLQSWQLQHATANDYKNKAADDLARLKDVLKKLAEIADSLPFSPAEEDIKILDAAPAILAKGCDILSAMYRPYFKASRAGMNRRELQKPKEDGIDWTPLSDQKDSGIDWYRCMGQLKEASEVFRGRVQGKPVVSTMISSV